MLDPRLLRSQLDDVARRLARRGFVLDIAAFQALEDERKRLQIESERVKQ
ncbi:MAG TPA: serine--tRNA ligase, partial [Burkholderiales bacterium]